MSEDVRPFEEYKEMIKDMRKEEMIKGLYDLSKNITEKEKEIERLNKQIEEYQKALDETTSEKIDLEKENNLLKRIIGNDKKYSYGIRMGSDKE